MNKHQQRVQEAIQFLTQNDTNVGFRKLLDCVTDTQDMAFYQKAIDLTDWKSLNPEQEATFTQKAIALLNEVANCPVQEAIVEKPVIIAQNLCKQYGYNAFSLGPVSLSINKGQVYGLVGENGNGKTTLLRILGFIFSALMRFPISFTITCLKGVSRTHERASSSSFCLKGRGSNS